MEHLQVTETFGVDGMTCAACSGAIERKLSKTEGIDQIAVNLSTTKATVTFDPSKIKLSEIKAIITKLGYEPRSTERPVTVDEEKESVSVKSRNCDLNSDSRSVSPFRF